MTSTQNKPSIYSDNIATSGASEEEARGKSSLRLLRVCWHGWTCHGALLCHWLNLKYKIAFKVRKSRHYRDCIRSLQHRLRRRYGWCLTHCRLHDRRRGGGCLLRL